MPDARVHLPKLAALRAYADDALRPAARARLERHIGQCPVCREALSGLRRYLQLATAVDEHAPRAHEFEAIDWARMEPALRVEAARLARRRRIRSMGWIGVGLAAAASLVIALVARQAPIRVDARLRADRPRRAAESPARPPAASLRAEVTAIVGTATAFDAARESLSMTLGSMPAEGWTLETGKDSEIHVALADTGAFVLKAQSRLVLRVLQSGQVELDLLQGDVVSQVLARKPSERFEVLAAGRRVRVHGTRFSVEALPKSIAVQVDEGVVHVLSEGGSLLVELRAPARWVQTTAATVPTKGSVRRIANRLPRPREAVVGGAVWPVLAVPVWSSIVQWQIDGADVAASAELRMRVPPGKVQVIGRLSDGRSMRGELWVDAAGARFDPSALRWAPSNDGSGGAEPAAQATADPVSASNVIRAGQPELQRCYEHSMRGQPVGAASIVQVRLRIEIDARGGVRRAELTGAAATPADLSACVQQVARSWRFAPPGEAGAMFEAPLRFRPSH